MKGGSGDITNPIVALYLKVKKIAILKSIETCFTLSLRCFHLTMARGAIHMNSRWRSQPRFTMLYKETHVFSLEDKQIFKC
jgi:hypothetical protein